MRQIADMSARALDNLAVGVDQRIGLARERRDFFRKAALEPFGGAGADRRKAGGDAFQGRKAEAHLEHGGEQQRGRQHAECHDECTIEGLRLILDLLRVARYGDEVPSFLAKVDGAFDEAQALVFRPHHITLARAVRPGRHVKVLKTRQAAVPQRA